MKNTEKVDGRSKASRRFKSIVSDIHRLVGDRLPPEIVAQQANQFAGLVLQQEKHIAKLLDAQPMNTGAYVRLVNASNRTLRLLGLLPADNGNDMEDGTDMLEKYIAGKKVGISTKRDRRRMRLVK